MSTRTVYMTLGLLHPNDDMIWTVADTEQSAREMAATFYEQLKGEWESESDCVEWMSKLDVVEMKGSLPALRRFIAICGNEVDYLPMTTNELNPYKGQVTQ